MSNLTSSHGHDRKKVKTKKSRLHKKGKSAGWLSRPLIKEEICKLSQKEAWQWYHRTCNSVQPHVKKDYCPTEQTHIEKEKEGEYWELTAQETVTREWHRTGYTHINMNQTGERRVEDRHKAKSKRAHQYGVHLNRKQTHCPLQIMKGRRNQDRFILEKDRNTTAYWKMSKTDCQLQEKTVSFVHITTV